MDFDTSWDPESYRTPFESDEHWKLKVDFILAHKESFPEDRLVCLAQVFANVELMGCKYPDKVMEQVGILAEDIASGYQASRENKAKRTFASAKDAANAKVQSRGRGRGGGNTNQGNVNNDNQGRGQGNVNNNNQGRGRY